jgi:hypothetical protein
MGLEGMASKHRDSAYQLVGSIGGSRSRTGSIMHSAGRWISVNFLGDVSNIDQRFVRRSIMMGLITGLLGIAVTGVLRSRRSRGGPLCLDPKSATLNCRYKIAWRYTP